MSFINSKRSFNNLYKTTKLLPKSLVPVNGHYICDIKLNNLDGSENEEYYKWQFIYSIVHSGMYPKENIGVEIHLPKGNKDSKNIKIDACIFSDAKWIEYYNKWKENKDYDAVEWLQRNMISIIEFKKSGDKINYTDMKKVYTSQIKAYIKQSEAKFAVGFYYDKERLFIFKYEDKLVLRYDESKNKNGILSGVNDLSLDLTDSYEYIPTFSNILNGNHTVKKDNSINQRTINDLQPIVGIHGKEINNAMSNILKVLDQVGLKNTKGYEVIIEMLALKIKDEIDNKNELTRGLNSKLKYYVTDDEKNYTSLSEENIKEFISRMWELHTDAQSVYPLIVKEGIIDWRNNSIIKLMVTIVENLQNYTFINSTKTDINQLVFYTFASEFKKERSSQFVTPLSIANFLVDILNPRGNDKVIDPTVGIGDFLSASYLKSSPKLEGNNLYGVDNDDQMIMLAQLNMLLSGMEKQPILKYKPNQGSILYKFVIGNELKKLDFIDHKNGNWDNWSDKNNLLKFDVVITNPPFGENRKIQPKTPEELKMLELYELWEKGRAGDWIDPGVVFLENAYRILKDGGRMGIILSNSIASIDRWSQVREWLLEKMRIVSVFDLPENVFAETGVNTTVIIAYKPSNDDLKKLQEQNYEIFMKEIKKIGYEVRTSNRIKYYHPIYKINYNDFETLIDENGLPIIDEELTSTAKEFKEWCNIQESKLKEIFIGGF